MKRLLAGTLAAALAFGLAGCVSDEECAEKPVIYLYPEQETAVSVSLNYDGTLTATYPAYENGWHITAEPDGTLYDETGAEYSYLSGRVRTRPTTTSPPASASRERTRQTSSAKHWLRSALPRRSTTNLSCTGCRKCRKTRTISSRSSRNATPTPQSWISTRNRTVCSAYSWRGSHCTGRRPSSRRRSRRLQETASPW